MKPAPDRLALLEARIAALENLLAVNTAAPPSDNWATVKVAAYRANLSTGRVYQLVDAKQIKSAKFAGHLFIDFESLARYKNTQRL